MFSNSSRLSSGTGNNQDDQNDIEYVPVREEDSFFNDKQNNHSAFPSSFNTEEPIHYLPAMDHQSNILPSSMNNNDAFFGQQQKEQFFIPGGSSFAVGKASAISNDKQEQSKARQVRQRPLKNKEPEDNFTKQSHMFFVPSSQDSNQSSSYPQPTTSSFGYENQSSGYAMPSFGSAPVVGAGSKGLTFNDFLDQEATFQQNTSYNQTYNTNQNTNPFNQSYNANYQSQNFEKREFKPMQQPTSSSRRVVLWILIFVALFTIVAVIYGVAFHTNTFSSGSVQDVPQTTTQDEEPTVEAERDLDSILHEHVTKFRHEEPSPVEKQQEEAVHASGPSGEVGSPIEAQTLGGNADQPKENDPYNFYDPYRQELDNMAKENKEKKQQQQQKKKPKKPIAKKKQKAVDLPQELYDRVYGKKKKGKEAKFQFQDEKIEKYLEGLSEKRFNRLSADEKNLIEKYIKLRENESFERFEKTSSRKYKKKGLKKKKKKVNPYEFDYNKQDDDSMITTSDPTLPITTAMDKQGKIHHLDPFGENEHENDEMYDEDMKNLMKNPNYHKYVDKHRLMEESE